MNMNSGMHDPSPCQFLYPLLIFLELISKHSYTRTVTKQNPLSWHSLKQHTEGHQFTFPFAYTRGCKLAFLGQSWSTGDISFGSTTNRSSLFNPSPHYFPSLPTRRLSVNCHLSFNSQFPSFPCEFAIADLKEQLHFLSQAKQRHAHSISFALLCR